MLKKIEHFAIRKAFESCYPFPKKDPFITYVIACKGRRYHLEQTLRKNIDDNQDYRNQEFLVIDYSSHDGLSGWVEANFRTEIESQLVRLIQVPHQSHWSFPKAKNIGHQLGRGDIICNLDADNFSGPNFSSYLVDLFKKNKNHIFSGHYSLVKGSTGRIAIRKAHYLLLGGYDEQLTGYGYDDVDLIERAQAIGIKNKILDARFLKLIVHPDEDRFRQFPPDFQTPKNLENERQSRKNIQMGFLTANLTHNRS